MSENGGEEECGEDWLRRKMRLPPIGSQREIDSDESRRTEFMEKEQRVELQRRLASDLEEAKRVYLEVHSLPTVEDYINQMRAEQTEDALRRKLRLPWRGSD
jgi:hypothetical protein